MKKIISFIFALAFMAASAYATGGQEKLSSPNIGVAENMQCSIMSAKDGKNNDITMSRCENQEAICYIVGISTVYKSHSISCLLKPTS